MEHARHLYFQFMGTIQFAYRKLHMLVRSSATHVLLSLDFTVLQDIRA